MICILLLIVIIIFSPFATDLTKLIIKKKPATHVDLVG